MAQVKTASSFINAARRLSAALAFQHMLLPASPAKHKRAKKAAALKTEPLPSSADAAKLGLARPMPGTFVDGYFECAQGTMTYKLYTPVGSTLRCLPMIVMLHGCTQSAADFAAGTNMNAIADELGFLVLYPEQSYSANFKRCWNWHRSEGDKRGSGEPAVITALTVHVLAACRGDPARVYIAGLSAGAVAAAIVAAEYPDVYAAVGVHSGLARGRVSRLSEALAAMRGEAGWSSAEGEASVPLPTIVFHGDEDNVVHPSNAGGFLKELEHAKPGPLIHRTMRGHCEGGRDFTRAVYRTRRGKTLLEDWTIHGSGHAWSGGSKNGSFTDPAGPNASREMVRFFLATKNAMRKVMHAR